MSEKPSTSTRRSYRTRLINVTDPKIAPMPEQDRAQAIAVLARWFAELLNHEDFRAKVEHHARENRTVTLRKVHTLARPLSP